FSAVIIAVLALGIGANTAMFSLIDAVLWKPLPFPEPHRMVRLWEIPGENLHNGATTLTFLDWKHQVDVFAALSVELPTTAGVSTGADPVRVEKGELVSASFFQVFGINAQLGRTFAANEDQPGAAPVVVISYAMWQSRFGADRNILNRDITLDSEPNRIIGVLPAGSFDHKSAQFWKPLIFAPEQMTRGAHWISAVGRLQEGVTLEQANAKLAILRHSLDKEMPKFAKDWTFRAEPYAWMLVGDNLRQSVYAGFGAVLMVLLIACANVANMLLAQGAARQKEMALRAALGASRGRLMLQLLTESWVLCLVGGSAGVAFAYALLKAATPLMAPYLPFTADLHIDGRVLAFAVVVAMLVTILAGLLPARLTGTLHQSARGVTAANSLTRRMIVVGEVALSVVLLTGAALLFKSLTNLQRLDAGVRIDHVITMSTALPLASYPKPENATTFYHGLMARVRALPGIEQASISQDLPMQGVRGGELFYIPGREDNIVVRFKRVDPNYFSVLDIPVLSGRPITERDRANTAKVVVINQVLKRLLSSKYGIGDPVGRTFRMTAPGYGKGDGVGAGLQVIGVIRNESTGDLQEPLDPVVYVPLDQYPREDFRILARTAQDPTAVVSGIREAVQQLDPKLGLADIRTMEEVKQRNLTWAKQPSWLIGAFAVVAAFLAALGLYGVLSHAVIQQRREIGIRMALGATTGKVLSRVLRNAFMLVAVGLAIGVGGALAVTRLMKALLFQVSPLDPAALAVAVVSMMAVGLLAGFLPANRASKVDPITTLREE
ncbi:MAG TPA: ABC transporter permease, partial [Bryobacteraceae bacterium]|nr:ABC transporter permease [Bryobacteraceae bacterium]